MTVPKIRNWQEFFTNIGAAMFVLATFAILFGSIFFGEVGVTWVTIVLVNPSLMIIGGAVGFGDLSVWFKALRAGELSRQGFFFTVFALGRAFAFLAIFYAFLSMELELLHDLAREN